MPVEDDTKKAKDEVKAAPATVALDTWCQSKSRDMGRRVEALSAFFKTCQKDGFGRATPEEFEVRFTAFLNTAA